MCVCLPRLLMDIDRFYQLARAAAQRLYGFYVKRPLQRYNVANRADKLIEREVARVAPRHEGTQQIFDQIIAEHPEIKKQLDERSDDLVNRLKAVKVVSKDVQTSEEEMKAINEAKQSLKDSYRLLPQSRTIPEFPRHENLNPSRVPKHKITIMKAIEFIINHSKNEKENTPEAIAAKYDLKTEDVQNILKYYKPFRLYEQNEDKPSSMFDIYLQPIDNVKHYVSAKIKEGTDMLKEKVEASNKDKKKDDNKDI